MGYSRIVLGHEPFLPQKFYAHLDISYLRGEAIISYHP